jgi:YesN/AraC family two-component response regulator
MTKSYRILIVDDEQHILDALEAAFLTTDLDIYTTDNPIRALEMIKETHFHVVISDIAMPQMNGLVLLRKIKEYNSFIQVIIITGYITITNALNAFRYGASDCFFKPFEDTDQIIDAMYNCIKKMERINNFLNRLALSNKSEKTSL